MQRRQAPEKAKMEIKLFNVCAKKRALSFQSLNILETFHETSHFEILGGALREKSAGQERTADHQGRSGGPGGVSWPSAWRQMQAKKTDRIPWDDCEDWAMIRRWLVMVVVWWWPGTNDGSGPKGLRRSGAISGVSLSRPESSWVGGWVRGNT